MPYRNTRGDAGGKNQTCRRHENALIMQTNNDADDHDGATYSVIGPEYAPAADDDENTGVSVFVDGGVDDEYYRRTELQ